ncbi:MAG: dihydrodipicolinate reductase [Chloroflexi bacterium]|nr:dihydrodipicolinate reductase [Chloroflexota bacterium]
MSGGCNPPVKKYTDMASTIPVIVQGLGPIGQRILLAAQNDARLTVVGAVDIDKRLIGRDLADLIEGAAPGVAVRPSLGQARAEAGLSEATVLQATTSYLDAAARQIEEALRLGLHVVSTCEELSYPFVRHPQLSASIDELARNADRTVVGTGINPGFLMDQLPVALSAASHDIQSVVIMRVQNPQHRRVPFQEKVGMNITRDEYETRIDSGQFGHVGLEESGWLIAAGLGWEIVDWEHSLEPVQPDQNGLVLGTLERLRGTTPDGKALTLHFEAQSGVDPPYDSIDIDGTPPLHLRFEGGVLGDEATAASILRCARVIPSAPRGLVTVLDLPLR